jgi:hypothetical protein
MASRRRYKAPQGFKDGGAVPVTDVVASPPVSTDVLPQAPALPPSDADGAVLQATRATLRAEQLQQTQAQPSPPPTIEQAIERIPGGISEHKKAFLRANPQFMTDRVHMTLMNKHYTAAMQAGVPDDTPEMDRILLEGVAHDVEDHRRTQQHVEALRSEPPSPPPEPPPAAPPKRSMPVTAPVSRAVPTPSSQTNVGRSVTLTGEERDLARRAYAWLSPDEAEREYALQKRRMLQMRAEGSLNDQ